MCDKHSMRGNITSSPAARIALLEHRCVKLYNECRSINRTMMDIRRDFMRAGGV